ncbi:glycosyltransferase family 2 protein [Acidipila sp. EB88]|uniref:glycosyltransferase family 2 protein n=1 Tax=Acidipila sp. EB88 TaxID=2305226 RepID=UPI000F5F4ED9|nr:glycosyltransferase family 2 protein [Acidipila sp. EB88]RRA47874.1 glycosyltransferase family 2 protein [Acidipila sp. EB88]
MLNGKKITVVLPAYNAARTLRQTVSEIPREIVDDIILTDDCSSDGTAQMACELGLHTLRHDNNLGYGGNQKTCYAAALERDADIVVMLHPDYQYTPKLVCAMASMIAYDEFDVVLASRILGKGALIGGMPRYKYVANRFLTLAENLLTGQKLSEYHTGYRAWGRKVLERLPLLACSDDFVFDNQMLVQCMQFGFRISEIGCPTRYFAEASSINFKRSVIYGMGVLGTAARYRLSHMGMAQPAFLQDQASQRLSARSHKPIHVALAGAVPALPVAEREENGAARANRGAASNGALHAAFAAPKLARMAPNGKASGGLGDQTTRQGLTAAHE